MLIHWFKHVGSIFNGALFIAIQNPHRPVTMWHVAVLFKLCGLLVTDRLVLHLCVTID